MQTDISDCLGMYFNLCYSSSSARLNVELIPTIPTALKFKQK